MKNNFKQNIKELKNVTDKIQQGNVSLKDSIKMFQQGITLSHSLIDDFNNAQSALRDIVGDDDSSDSSDTTNSRTSRNHDKSEASKSFFK